MDSVIFYFEDILELIFQMGEGREGGTRAIFFVRHLILGVFLFQLIF